MRKIKSLMNFILRNIPIHIINLLTGIFPNSNSITRIRGIMIKPFLGKCGKNFRIASGVIILKPENIEIGNNVYIAHNVWINAVGGLKIGSEAIISPNVVIDTTRHLFVDGKVTHKGEHAQVSIGEGSWVAANSVITDGVMIGEGVLVGAGAVVTHSTEDNAMYVGVPAQKIK